MLVIGTRTNDPEALVRIDLAGLLHHTLVVGQSGSGKSFFVARLVEEIMSRTRARVVVLDPNGDFSSFAETSTSIWGVLGDRFKSLAALESTHGISPLDDQESFASSWEGRRFVYLVAGQGHVPHVIHSRISRRRLLVHWNDLDEERDFLLEADAGTHPTVALGLQACEENLEWLGESRPELGYTPDLRGLIKVAEAFANKNVGLSSYDYVKNLDVNDWNAVRARFFELLKKYTLWWSQPGTRQSHRPDGLVDFLDQAFPARGTGRRSWDLLTLSLDSASREDQLLAADVALWRLWKNAKQAWRDRMASGQGSQDARVPIFVVVDEAHNFAPADAGNDPLRQRVADRLIQIASEGRKYGLYLILATQRPTKLHPELVPECENSCVLRVQSALEQDFAARTLGIPADLARTAARFTKGQGLLSGRWVGGDGPVDAIAAPARTRVGGGGLGTDWMAEPEVPPSLQDSNPLVLQLRALIDERLRDAPSPVPLVSLAEEVMREFPDEAGPSDGWLGTGSFKQLLIDLKLDALRFLTHPPPGYAYLEGVHDPGDIRAYTALNRSGLPAVAHKVHDELGIPLLTADQFAAVFSEISEAVGTEEFRLARVAKAVRDSLRSREQPVTRSAIEFVIKGISFGGHSFGADLPQDPGTLSAAFLQNVQRLALRNGLDLTEDDQHELREWTTGPTLLVEPGDASPTEALGVETVDYAPGAGSDVDDVSEAAGSTLGLSGEDGKSAAAQVTHATSIGDDRTTEARSQGDSELAGDRGACNAVSPGDSALSGEDSVTAAGWRHADANAAQGGTDASSTKDDAVGGTERSQDVPPSAS